MPLPCHLIFVLKTFMHNRTAIHYVKTLVGKVSSSTKSEEVYFLLHHFKCSKLDLYTVTGVL